LWLAPLVAGAFVDVPRLERRVTDLTSTLSAAEVAAIEHKLAALEERKGSQIAVLLLPSTKPETIEQFSIRVAEAWQVGRKGVDDGAILIVATDDRTLRIEVGYGLEGVLPDAIARSIIGETIVPHLRAGGLAGGIDAGIDAMVRVIDGEPLPAPRNARGPFPAGKRNVESLFTAVLVGSIVGGGILRAMLGRLPAAAIIGTVVGLVGWAIAASLVLALVAGMAAFLLTLFGVAPGAGAGFRHPGGFGGGGWSGRGWSGGGGGFGGGGASGRW
jgi:uncharacterized protein